MYAVKYRPKNFSEVVDQDTAVTFVRNLVKNPGSASYIFEGSFGSGKTTLARIFARALLCEKKLNGCEPCNHCGACVSALEDKNFNIQELDAASSNSVDDVRKLKEDSQYKAIGGGKRVVILDEAHMLTVQAQNAMLKMLEDGAGDTVFVLCTTNPEKIIPTIRSRCRTVRITPISQDGCARRILEVAEKEKITITDAAAEIIAKATHNHMRDALTALEQVHLINGDVTEEATTKVLGLARISLLDDVIEALINQDTDVLPILRKGAQEVQLRQILEGLEDYILHKRRAEDYTKLDQTQMEGVLSFFSQLRKYRTLDPLTIEVAFLNLKQLIDSGEITGITMISNKRASTRVKKQSEMLTKLERIQAAAKKTRTSRSLSPDRFAEILGATRVASS